MKSKSRGKETVNSPNISGLQCQKMQRKKSIKTHIRNQKTKENSENIFCGCWEKYVSTTKGDDWIEFVSYRN
jgi:hypothetical protein